MDRPDPHPPPSIYYPALNQGWSHNGIQVCLVRTSSSVILSYASGGLLMSSNWDLGNVLLCQRNRHVAANVLLM